VKARQVVVHGDDVHAPAGQRVQVGRKRGDQGLALSRLHFGDLAAVKGDAPDQLDIEVTLAQGALGGLPHGCEGLGQQRVQLLPPVQALAKLGGLGLELGIGEADEFGLEPVHQLDERDNQLDLAVVLGTEDLLEKILHGGIDALPTGDLSF
jgi:hypothetical protein